MIDESLLEAEEKMEKAVVVAKEEFSGIRTGRPNSAAVATARTEPETSPAGNPR